MNKKYLKIGLLGFSALFMLLFTIKVVFAVAITYTISVTKPLLNVTSPGAMKYVITVGNTSGTPTSNPTITDTFPPQLSNVVWDCKVASGTADCDTTSGATTASGSGNLNITTARIPSGSSITITVVGEVTSTTNIAANTATVTAGAGDTGTASSTATAVTPTAVTAFGLCPGEGYYMRGTGTILSSLNIATGVKNQINATMGAGSVNALAFNQKDGFLYVNKVVTSVVHIYKVDISGAGIDLGVVDFAYYGFGASPASVSGGEFRESSGVMYMIPNNSKVLYTIDLNPNSRDFMRATSRVTLTTDASSLAPIPATSINVGDIAINPVDYDNLDPYFLYGTVDSPNPAPTPNNILLKIDPVTGYTKVLLGLLPANATTYGGVFFARSGTMYIVSNATGQFYGVTFNSTRTSSISQTIGGTDGGGSNTDGARCYRADDPVDVQIVKTSDVSTVSSGQTVHFKLEVTNNGPPASVSGTATDIIDSNQFTVTSFTCTPSGTSTCGSFSVKNQTTGITTNSPALPLATGPIYEYYYSTGFLTVGAPNKITYNITATALNAGGISNTATVALPTYYTDSYPPNNTSSINSTINATKAFSPTEITPGSSSNLTFTLNNSPGSLYTGVGFTDTLPTSPGAMTVSATPNIQTNCPAGGATYHAMTSGTADSSGQTVTATANTGTFIALSAFKFNAGVTTCDVRVDVKASAIGTYTNTYASNISAVSNIDARAINASLAVGAIITGTVFEDINYGGGLGRSKATSSGVNVPNARVELYNSSGAFVTATTTNSSGAYSFGGLAAGNYTVRTVNSTVKSTRAGTSTEIGLQTYRTTATTGAAVAVTDRVGGEAPEKVDAASNTTSATLASLTAASNTPQSITTVTVSVGSTTISSVDFGFNFDTIVNTNDSGQGSLRQFILNSNILGAEGSLAQSGNTYNALTNTTSALPAGKETSIFMISDGLAHNGLRAGLTNQLTSNIAKITPTSVLTAISGTTTVLDGGTQTANIGNTNNTNIGDTSTVVGTGSTTLTALNGPEVEITGANSGLSVTTASNEIDRVALTRVAGGATGTAISLSGASNCKIEQVMIGGSSAASFTSGSNFATGISFTSADSLEINDSRIKATGVAINGGSSTGVKVQRNEITSDVTGGTAASGAGIDISIGSNTSGISTMTVDGNYIYNNAYGLLGNSSATTGNQLTNNTIKTNTNSGIALTYGETNYTISTNTITNNGGAGILLSSTPAGIKASQNVYGTNSYNSIDLSSSAGSSSAVGVTTNTACTLGSFANNGLGRPVITTSTLVGGTLTVSGTMCSSGTYTIEVYKAVGVGTANATTNNDYGTDSLAAGEGVSYIGSITPATGGTFTKTFTGTGLAIGDYISAILIETTSNNTSEFSANSIVENYDYGDAPNTYSTLNASNGAKHGSIGGTDLKIGSAVTDVETDGPASGTGVEDNTTGTDDEDGLTVPLPILTTVSTTYNLNNIPVVNSTGSDAILGGWVDFNKNGTFDTGEFASATVASGATTATLSWTGLTGIVAGQSYVRLRITSTSNTLTSAEVGGLKANGEVEDYPVTIYDKDFGDAPDTYKTLDSSGGPKHTISTNLKIGSAVTDIEADGPASGTGVEDDTAGTDDEDGLTVPLPTLTTASTTYNLNNIPVVNSTGSDAILGGWVDFNKNGTFDTGEFASATVASGATTATLSWTGLTGIVVGQSYVRLRITSTSNTLTSAEVGGLKANGEVEDYPVTIVQALDYGDLPDSYKTLLASDGARHTIDSTAYLGTQIDYESDGPASGDGTQDDTTGVDDEDGIVFNPALYPGLIHLGQTNTLQVTASKNGFISMWVDYNNDGDFADLDEQVFNDSAVTAGINSKTFSISNLYDYGNKYIRIRYSTVAGQSNSTIGLASDGEVEDYKIYLASYPQDCSTYTNASGVIGNGSFEDTPAVATYLQTADTNIPYWKTTAPDKLIEVWKSGFNGVPSNSFSQFAEINATGANALYQDVITIPNSTVYIHLAHRGRSGTDVAAVKVGAPGSLSLLGNLSDGNTSWGEYDFSYAVPPGQTVTRIQFEAVSSTGGLSYGNFVDSISAFSTTSCETANKDFGDAPDSYGTLYASNGARHSLSNPGLKIGAVAGDAESDGPATGTGVEDDNTSDDEDGVTLPFPTLTTKTTSYNLTVPVRNSSGLGITGNLMGWIDFNGNGVFDSGEASANVTVADGFNSTKTLNWATVPSDIKAGNYYIRLRITYDGLASTDAKGGKTGGEVEDYPITIRPVVKIIKTIVPAADSGKFNLTVTGGNPSGGTNPANDVINNGTTDFVAVDAAGAITVEETAGTATNLTNYSTSLSCTLGDGTTPVTVTSPILTGATRSGSLTAPATGTTGNASQVICTFTNEKLPTVTITKESLGGVGTFDFTGNNGFTNTSITTITDSIGVAGTTRTLTAAGVATTIIESAPPAGFSLIGISCGGLASGGTASVNLGTRSLLLDATATAAGSNINCTFTNRKLPTVTITKVSNGGVGTFDFTGDNGFTNTSITTITSGVGVVGATKTLTLANAATTITESLPPAGFTLTGISCSGLGSGGTATPNLGTRSVLLDAAATVLGSDIACTFTNTKLPTVTVTKISNGGVGAFDFTGDNGFTNTSITTATSGVGVAGTTRTLTAAGVATTITESAPPAGFTLTGISCSGLGSGTATPNLGTRSVLLDATATAAGNTVACTFTNTKLPTVTVTKISNGDVGTFDFTGDNGFTNTSITTVTSGVGVAGTTRTLTAAGVATTITESAPPAGFALTGISCGGLGTVNLGTRSVSFTIAETAVGSDIACTFTNTKLPTITVTKISNGGVGTFDFTGDNGFTNTSITTVTSGVGVAGTTRTLTAAGTATTITESAPPAGFALTGISCGGLGTVNLGTRSVSFTIAETAAGSNIACTFTNTKLPTITVTKISNGDVGTFDFTGDNGFTNISITTVTSGVGVAGTTRTLTAAGVATTITESAPPAGFALTGISCSGLGSGTATPNLGTRSVLLDASATTAGNTVACTFTNTKSVTSTISGFVYNDKNKSTIKDGNEDGLGTTAYVKLCQTGAFVDVATVNTSTGAYTLSNVTDGTYDLVETTDNSNSNCNASDPSGWVSTTPNTKSITVAGSNLVNQNFGDVYDLQMTVTKTVNPTDPAPGQIIEYTITLANTGTATFNNVVVTDIIPANTSYQNETIKITDVSKTDTADGDNADFNSSGKTITANIGSITGGTTVTVKFKVLVSASAIKIEINNSAKVTSTDLPTPISGDNKFTTQSLLQFFPNNTLNSVPGAIIFYPHEVITGTPGTVTLAYTSSQNWKFTIFRDVNENSILDAGDTQYSEPVSLGDVYNLNGTHSVKILAKVQIPTDTAGNITDNFNITATLTPTDSAKPALTASVNDITTVGTSETGSLKLIKSVLPTGNQPPGTTLVYTIKYTNEGIKDLSDIEIADVVPEHTTFVSVANGGIYNAGTKEILWTISGTLAPGASGTVQFTIQVQ